MVLSPGQVCFNSCGFTLFNRTLFIGLHFKDTHFYMFWSLNFPSTLLCLSQLSGFYTADLVLAERC